MLIEALREMQKMMAAKPRQYFQLQWLNGLHDILCCTSSGALKDLL